MKGMNVSIWAKKRKGGIWIPLILIFALLVLSSSAAIANTQLKSTVGQIPGTKVKLGELQKIYNQLVDMQIAMSALMAQISQLFEQLKSLTVEFRYAKREQQAHQSQLNAHKQNKPQKPKASDFTSGGEVDYHAYNAAMNTYNQNLARWQSDLNRLTRIAEQHEKKLQAAAEDIKKAQDRIKQAMRKLREMEDKINKLLRQALAAAQKAKNDPTLSSREKAEIQSKYRKIQRLSKNMKNKIKKHLAGKRTLIAPQKRLKR